MRSKVPAALVGICGVHCATYELSRRGMIALPTTRNTAAYDMIVVSRDGKRHANVQVKAAQRSVRFWPMPPSRKIWPGPNDFYVLVGGLREGQIKCFLVKGEEAQSQVKKNEARMRRRDREVFPCIYVSGKHSEAGNRWKKSWEKWNLRRASGSATLSAASSSTGSEDR